MSTTLIRCAACGHVALPLDPRPFRCPNGGSDDGDHLFIRELQGASESPFFDDESNPFVRFRRFTHAWHVAREIGMGDAEFVALVRQLDGRVAQAGGTGFVTTPFSRAFGRVWVKDETRNVSGSHKGRHMMGLMIWLLVAERIDPAMRDEPLAIASCGNAALAAATLARAAGRRLKVFVPASASPHVIAQLEGLGAEVTVCPRTPGIAGDPSYLRFREAVADGALPFTCQGNENGLVIEAGQTLGWELATQLAAAHTPVDDLYLQVGGGALGSAVATGLFEAQDLGVLAEVPRVNTVQTEAAYPLRRAWDCMVTRGATLDYAIHHRSEFMWPWESEPHSVAHGILDDETYDWAALVAAMQRTGGGPVVVSEARLEEAHRLAHTATPIDVCHTGSSGLAGLLEGRGAGAVIFTGAQR